MGVSGVELRAREWDEYVGQADLKAKLDVFIQAAIRDKRMLEHVLLVAHPGYGKTTLANIIADQVGDMMVTMIGQSGKIKTVISELRKFDGGILFLDEIHRFSTADQEALLPLLEDGFMQTQSGRRIDFPNVTVIGATTEPHKVIEPLWDRFIIKPTFAEYDDNDMADIVQGMARKSELDIPDRAVAVKLGRATGGTPRLAVRIVLSAQALHGKGATITDDMVEGILWQAGTDEDGLTEEHQAYLKVLMDFGGVAGLRNIVSMLHLPTSEVENTERLLIKKGILALEPGGRTLTNDGYKKAAGVPADVLDRRRRIVPQRVSISE